MRQRWKFGLASVVAISTLGLIFALLLGWKPVAVFSALLRRTEPPIRVGLIHSKTGYLAISEKSLLDAEILAIEEINAAGGINNRQVVYSDPDCQSDPNVFSSQARRLLEDERVTALFGTWTSECRKAVAPVVDESKSLLFFPGNYEGIEKSARVIYVGGIANQSILPAVRWAFDTLKARRFFVIGLEEVWSRCTSEIAKDGVKAAGAEVVGEKFMTSGTTGYSAVIEAIQQAKPDVVLNFIFGDSNPAFYSALQKAGLTAEKLPVIAFGFSETEVAFGFNEDKSRRFVPADVIDQYAAWNYFQSVSRRENREFVQRFRDRWGADRLIGDSMVAAYNSVKFWAKAMREVGFQDNDAVINNLNRQSIDAPDGIITIDAESRAAWRPFHLGRFRSNGQFEIVWSITKPIRPVMFVGTRTPEQWRTFLEDLKIRWRGRWSMSSVFEPLPPLTSR